MYAAKKYLLTGLMKEILKVVRQTIDADTVCTLLEQSMVSTAADEVKDACLAFISNEAHRVFKTEEFLRLSYDALEEIICLSCLALTSEVQVYEYCVMWARHQLREVGNECPSDDEIRDKLGNALYNIRFPVIGAKDFAELTAQSTVLTAEEKHDIYVFMASGKSLETLKFVTQRRSRMLENVIKRFDNICDRTYDGKSGAVSFTTTVNMYLTGIGLYGGTTASTHEVTITVLKDGKALSTLVTKMASNGRKCPIKFQLQNPVFIRASVRYAVTTVIKGPRTWAGRTGSGNSLFSYTHNFPIGPSGRIDFHQVEISQSVRSNVYDGQIPELYYYLESQ